LVVVGRDDEPHLADGVRARVRRRFALGFHVISSRGGSAHRDGTRTGPVASDGQVRPSSALTTEALVTHLRRTPSPAAALLIAATLLGVAACAPTASIPPSVAAS